MCFRQSWSLETRAEWFTSGIWRLTTMNSWSLSQRCRWTLFTLTRMPVTWQLSTARSVPGHSEKELLIDIRFHLMTQRLASVLQGNCYVWNVTGGIGEEVTQLIPKTKIPAHKRYSLRCKFSPDSTWVPTFTIASLILSTWNISLHWWSSPVCWPPAQPTRPVRYGGRPTSRWWQSWASRATTPGRRLEAGCGTVRSPETPSILLLVSMWALANGLSSQYCHYRRHSVMIY